MKSLVFLCFTLIVCGNFINAQNVKSTTQRIETVIKNGTATAATHKPATISTTPRPPLAGLRLPCSCIEGQCGCCTGAVLQNFNQKACVNFTYVPEDFALTAAMSMNGRVLFKRTVSGKNPPPMCFRLPRLQFVRFCVQFSNIYFASRNVHFCIDMEANWEDLTLVDWSFDCIRMGASGVAVVGPEEGGGLPANPIDSIDQTDEDYDDSARNVPLNPPNFTPKQNTTGNKVIFDESIKEIDGLKPDRALIKVETLPNGDIFIGPNKPK